MKALQAKKETKEAIKTSLADDKKVTIVLFYALWCPHCQAMKPSWDAAAKKLASKRNVQVIEAEYSDLAHVPAKYKKGVQGFPTVRKIKGGKVIEEYYGDRSTDSMVEFATKA